MAASNRCGLKVDLAGVVLVGNKWWGTQPMHERLNGHSDKAIQGLLAASLLATGAGAQDHPDQRLIDLWSQYDGLLRAFAEEEYRLLHEDREGWPDEAWEEARDRLRKIELAAFDVNPSTLLGLVLKLRIVVHAALDDGLSNRNNELAALGLVRSAEHLAGLPPDDNLGRSLKATCPG